MLELRKINFLFFHVMSNVDGNLHDNTLTINFID